MHASQVVGLAGMLLLLAGLMFWEFGYGARAGRLIRARAIRFKQQLLGDALHRSSTLLIAAQGVNAVAAFIFWVLCARLFPAREVGLATALISYAALTAAFTQLGLPVTTLRFLPTSKYRKGLLSASIGLVGLSSLFGGLFAVGAIGVLAPKLGFVRDSLVLSLSLVAVVVGTSFSALLDGVMTSLQQSRYVLTKAIVTNVPRVVLPFAIVALGVQGIVGVYMAMLLLGGVYSLTIILRKFLPGGSLRPQFHELGKHRSFATANYFGSMLGILPGTLTPLIVLEKLGPSQAAFFYMPMQLAVFLSIIAGSTCQALLAETAQQKNDNKQYVQMLAATRQLYRLLIPAALGLGIGGWLILRFYGADYAAQGIAPLLVLCAASLFVALNWIGDTWLNIRKKSLAYFLMNGCNALTVVGSVFLFASHGLLSVAVGWLIGQALSAAIYVALFARSQLAVFLPKALRYTA